MTDIRPLSIAHLEQVYLLASDSLREGFHFVQRFADQIHGVPLDTSTQWFLGLFDSDALRAIGGVTPDPYVDDPLIGRIRHVYVESAYRRRGYASLLLTALEARAASVYPILRLRTDAISAAAFYEQRGYAPVRDAYATHIRQRVRVPASTSIETDTTVAEITSAEIT